MQKNKIILWVILLISSCNGNHLIDDRNQHEILVDYKALSKEYLFQYYDTINKIMNWSDLNKFQSNKKECRRCYELYKDVTLSDHLDDRLYFFNKYPCIMFKATYYSHVIGIDICKDSTYLDKISSKDSLKYVQIFNQEVVENMKKYALDKILPDSLVYKKNLHQ